MSHHSNSTWLFKCINLQLQTSDFVDCTFGLWSLQCLQQILWNPFLVICNCNLIRLNNQVLLDDGNRIIIPQGNFKVEVQFKWIWWCAVRAIPFKRIWEGRKIFFFRPPLPHFIEPTCAYCTVGSYASLSVRLSVCHWIIIHISKSITAMNLKLCNSIKPS